MFKIDFKISLITFKGLHDLAPDYILDLLIPYAPLCSLRSLDRGLLSLPESRLKTEGDRGFAIKAPRLWSDLPEEIGLSESLLLKKKKSRVKVICVCVSLISQEKDLAL